jgi:2-amino-4-hydroxy-6-hydroxymethyldihydropteridine diphosphokinase
MPRVFVSVGSNIERTRHICMAVQKLRARYGKLVVSSVYESAAVGFAGDPFYNLVVGFDTDDPPLRVAQELYAIEEACGRSRTGPRFSARTLDLDLLLYGDLVLQEKGRSIPHPQTLSQAFVLGPLAEIAGGLCHPGEKRTYLEFWTAFDPALQNLRRVDFDP